MWNDRYNINNYIYGKEANDFLLSVVDQIPKGRILCIGEGERRNTVLDLSENALKKAQLSAQENKAEIKTIANVCL